MVTQNVTQALTQTITKSKPLKSVSQKYQYSLRRNCDRRKLWRSWNKSRSSLTPQSVASPRLVFWGTRAFYSSARITVYLSSLFVAIRYRLYQVATPNHRRERDDLVLRRPTLPHGKYLLLASRLRQNLTARFSIPHNGFPNPHISNITPKPSSTHYAAIYSK